MCMRIYIYIYIYIHRVAGSERDRWGQHRWGRCAFMFCDRWIIIYKLVNFECMQFILKKPWTYFMLILCHPYIYINFMFT